jgi:N-acyl-L-homoserine lactone synthetase
MRFFLSILNYIRFGVEVCMAVKIKLITEPKDIDGLFKVRHLVFADQEHYVPENNSKRITDLFDTYPTSHHFAVFDDNRIVGGARVTVESPVGLPSDDYYNFRNHLPQDSVIMSSSMFCLSQDIRNPQVALGLMLMEALFAITNKITHVVAPINPLISRLIKRIGFLAVGEQFNDHQGHETIPMVLDLKNLNGVFVKFLDNNKLYNFLLSYECHIFRKGEYVIRQGDSSDCAYVIIDGEVEVFCESSGEVVGTYSEGRVFGELGLITDDIHSLSARATTNLRVMTLPKVKFIQNLHQKPDDALKMLKDIGNRLKNRLTQNT